MKCDHTTCRTLAKEHQLLLEAIAQGTQKTDEEMFNRLTQTLNQCNACFYKDDATTREKRPSYHTRNTVGAAYAYAFFKKN